MPRNCTDKDIPFPLLWKTEHTRPGPKESEAPKQPGGAILCELQAACIKQKICF
ncbi:hypothetical protein ANACOL_04002 [Anaerotruncus colihominis DSM 17241]|uniref:Uncharacterized protein n=1 Tax=Anaerotruncus colihominis DSM 17241 TaxID=445972 RepID=B0PGY0_9FIRM|nr:hypothetical protein ANACOL_04002 [Anaerotruncus colihominis DSM 17241]